jgi:CheY-like chemotaxis protein
MDGNELVRSIRESGPAASRQVPAVALTAYTRALDRVKALSHGFQLHLAKPVDPGELVDVVVALTDRASV